MRFLIDEMFPPRTAGLLRDDYGHDAVHVIEAGLGATPDAIVVSTARDQHRVIVTENVVDYAREREVVLAFAQKRNLAAGSAQAPSLAELLDAWATANPRPYIGHHWPA